MNLKFEHVHPKQNPYDGFPLSSYPYRPFTHWGSQDPNFAVLIKKVQPETIIEVGTWYGGSIIHMADICEIMELNTILCTIDTFLGAEEMYEDTEDTTRYGALMLDHGRPSFYNQTLANIMHTGHQHHVIPWPQTSLIASRRLKKLDIKTDMVYLDGSHHYDDVLADLNAFWPLVKVGGVLFGDDYFTFMDVGRAVQHFTEVNNLHANILDRQWEIWKV